MTTTDPMPMSGTQPSLYQQLRGHLAALKLTAAAEHLPSVLAQAEAEQWSMTATLEHLLAREVEATEARKLAGRLRFASLPTPATLAGFDFDAAPGIDRKLLDELATCRYLESATNVLLIGPPGVGKTPRRRTRTGRSRSRLPHLLHDCRRPRCPMPPRRDRRSLGHHHAVLRRTHAPGHRPMPIPRLCRGARPPARDRVMTPGFLHGRAAPLLGIVSGLEQPPPGSTALPRRRRFAMSGTRRKPGQLGPQVEGYRAWLAQQGYTPDTVRNMLKDLGQVGRWLSAEGLGAEQLNEERIAAFLASRRGAGRRKVPGPRAMVPLLRYLRAIGVAEEPQPSSTPLGGLLARYRTWMVQERGLAAATVLRYENTARRFLHEQASDGDVLATEALTGADVNAFLLRECARVSSGSAKGRVAELRSLLRFLYLQGITPLRLGLAVPPVGGWRFAGLPPTVSAADVQLLLDSCDRGTPIGLRDFAMMTLVARLGLRSIEVARLELSDLDWRTGELVVRGKARRQDRLPLPADVGEALVGYLSAGRNPAGARHVFLTFRAPRRAIRADLVGDVVERACKRAGQPVVGPHRLRHALAGDLLRKGAGLVAISQVLRHQDLATTALYAKVDLDTLRQVAQPWPGAQR